jgi:T5SS/PEP-CTERM-associated repeat protein
MRNHLANLILLFAGATSPILAPLHAQLVVDGGTTAINGIATNLTGNLTVGNSGSFTTLVITNQGTVTNSAAGIIGAQFAAHHNSVIVTGPGSVWANGTTLAIGSSGSLNQLLITNGGLVANTFGNIGFNSGSSSNRVVVTGSGSHWVCTETVNVGNSSPYCSVLIAAGGRVTAHSGRLGNGFASLGNSLVITDPGSEWSSDNAIWVGEQRNFNQLVISNGATALSYGAYAGGNFAQSGSGHSNSVIITGTGSTWTNTSTSSIGNFGSGNQFIISNGGVLRNTSLFAALVLGWQPSGSNNSLVVTGPNALFSNRGTSAGLNVGFGGSFNRVEISNGGRVEGDSSGLGENPSSSNNLAVVSGTGSTWQNGFELRVGNTGSGNQLVISNGGWVITPSLLVGSQPTSSANLVSLSGGILSVTNLAHSARTDVRRGGFTLASGTFESDWLVLTNTQSEINLHGGLARVRQTLCTSGNIFTIGDDATPVMYELVGNGTHTFAGGLQIVYNAILAGQGSIIGNVTNLNGGTLAPGAAVGVLTNLNIVGSLSMNPGSGSYFEISKSALTNDHLAVSETISYGGTLSVSNLAGDLASGDRFKLFTASSYSGSFDTLVLPALNPGLLWTNKLSLDGSIEVYETILRDFGVDVSHFQGESGISQTSWNQMFADGKKFAFIKATEGLTGPDDATMANNMTRATAAGILAGVYHYAHPENRPTTNGAVQEADHFLAYAGNFIGPGYLRPVIDVEFSASILGTTELTDWVIAFSDRIIALRGTNAAPIVYCNQAFATSEFDGRLANYDLWLRVVGGGFDPAVDDPGSTGVFNNWSFWQYSATGSSGGISPLDLNVCHSEFKPLHSFLIPTNASPVAPIITTPPSSQLVAVGSAANFAVSISITSSPPIFYQWRFNGTNIPGALQPSYQRAEVQLSDAGAYDVVVSNGGGVVTSTVALLTVFTPYVLYQENFDAYDSPSIVTTDTTTNGFKLFWNAASGPLDFTAQFGFDYSTVTAPATIPPAPASLSTTKGLALTVNKDISGAAAAINLYPVSQVFTGDYAFKFDLWINWTNTSAATEHTLFGINHSGAVTNRVGLPASDGLFFAMNGDGGSTSTSPTLRDYSVFRGATNGIPVLLTTGFGPAPLLGAQFDNGNPGFTSLFPSQSVLNFNTPPGSAGLSWVRVEVRQENNLVTWYLNHALVAQYPNPTAYTNGNILIGYNDNFASVGAPGNFAIFDNLRVESIGPDYDGDGLLDQWEAQYFTNLSADPNADSDGDGAINGNEFRAGTNPTNALSAFMLLDAVRNGADVQLSFTTVGGHSYIVQHVVDATASFTNLSGVISVAGTVEGVTNYIHVGGATNGAGFYRIRLEP